ncbi:hypothetical protein Tco_0140196 [Tanacetum coccineum]
MITKNMNPTKTCQMSNSQTKNSPAKELAYNQGDILHHVYTMLILKTVSLELPNDQIRLKQSSNSKKRKLRLYKKQVSSNYSSFEADLEAESAQFKNRRNQHDCPSPVATCSLPNESSDRESPGTTSKFVESVIEARNLIVIKAFADVTWDFESNKFTEDTIELQNIRSIFTSSYDLILDVDVVVAVVVDLEEEIEEGKSVKRKLLYECESQGHPTGICKKQNLNFDVTNVGSSVMTVDNGINEPSVIQHRTHLDPSNMVNSNTVEKDLAAAQMTSP